MDRIFFDLCVCVFVFWFTSCRDLLSYRISRDRQAVPSALYLYVLAVSSMKCLRDIPSGHSRLHPLLPKGSAMHVTLTMPTPSACLWRQTPPHSALRTPRRLPTLG
ncbi:unnamed protein product, partial [Pylaiella littoralis]